MSWSEFAAGTLRAQPLGVNPSVETILDWHTCRLLSVPSQRETPLMQPPHA